MNDNSPLEFITGTDPEKFPPEFVSLHKALYAAYNAELEKSGGGLPVVHVLNAFASVMVGIVGSNVPQVAWGEAVSSVIQMLMSGLEAEAEHIRKATRQ